MSGQNIAFETCEHGQRIAGSLCCACLERQLAEAQTMMSAKCTISGCWKSKYEEAREKLEALREDAKKVQDAGPSKDDQWWIDRILPLSLRLDRILGGKGD